MISNFEIVLNQNNVLKNGCKPFSLCFFCSLFSTFLISQSFSLFFFLQLQKFLDNSSYSLLAQLLLAQATEAHTSPLILLPVRQHI
jgi:hypothetical protein